MRILHLLHRSVPGAHGYAVRSRIIVRKQRAIGLDPIVVTSPSQAPQGALDQNSCERIDDIPYYRSCSRILPPTVDVSDGSPVRSALRVLQNVQFLSMVDRLAKKLAPDIIHAHSPFTCGLIANWVGRRNKIPSVYELRGVWEDSHVGRRGLSIKSFRYRTVRYLENKAIQGASRCMVICDALKEELVSRGIPGAHIGLSPNGVDVDTFIPDAADPALLESLGLRGKRVIGFIGSFFNYEALDLLVDAFALLARKHEDLALLLVGDGEAMPMLKERAAEHGLGERIVFPGRAPYDEIMNYYRLCDIFVLPRRETPETRIVTPLKPLEIMCMEKPLVASNIGGHRELVMHDQTGLLFEPENVQALAEACDQFLQNDGLRDRIARQGRAWAVENRDWSVLMQNYVRTYQHLLARQGTRSNQ